MKLIWTNDDAVALAEFVTKGVGSKLIRYLAENRPLYPEDLDLQKMALAAAVAKGYDQALASIDQLTMVKSAGAPKAKYVQNLEQD
jgi:hypothetical protein